MYVLLNKCKIILNLSVCSMDVLSDGDTPGRDQRGHIPGGGGMLQCVYLNHLYSPQDLLFIKM